MSNQVSLAIALLCVLTTAPCAAQVAWLLEGESAPGNMRAIALPSAAQPNGDVFAGLANETAFLFGPGGTVVPNGGIAIDANNRRLIVVDGGILTVRQGFADPLGGAAGQQIFGIPPLLGGGNFTGCAVDDVGILWLCDAISFRPFIATQLGVLPAGQSIPVPGANAGVAISGIDWDPVSQSLWACDIIGQVFNFTTAGVSIGTQPVATVAPQPGLAMGGICVNRTDGAGAHPPPFCSTQTDGFHVSLTDGIGFYDAIPGTAAPLIVNMTFPIPPAMGLAFAYEGQILDAGQTCQSTQTQLPEPKIRLAQTARAMNPGLNHVMLHGGPANSAAFLLVDFCPVLPFGIPQQATGDLLWLNPFTSTFSHILVMTDVTGTGGHPFATTTLPPGAQVSMQYAMVDPAHTIGFCFTDAMTVTFGL